MESVSCGENEKPLSEMSFNEFRATLGVRYTKKRNKDCHRFITCPVCKGERFDADNRLCPECGGDSCVLVKATTDGFDRLIADL